MRVERTVIPDLPSTVLARLNDPAETHGSFLGSLPFRRLVMEARTPIGPARVVFDTETAGFDIPETPHYSLEFCRQIGKQSEGGHLDYVEGRRSHQQSLGAQLLYANIAGRPLTAMNFKA